ncbi:MAG: type IV pilus twitching motility protein PilT [Candidatus Stahlbacteria bacterium]|nr:MAG: type IV pilus twitching motility protein PilT [Candidatus Stahlbacteria bacterium]
MNIGDLLSVMKERCASDLILKEGSVPVMRINRELVRMEKYDTLTEDDIKRVAESVMSRQQLCQFEKTKEMDLAVNVPGLSRFRVNVFSQRSCVGIVFRIIPKEILDIDNLNMPPILKEFAMKPRGMILVTGPSGCGKSTTIAAMVDYRNKRDTCHIITIEDPIEFIYEDKKAIIDQRGVGMDTHSFSSAIKYSLRQDPDVIIVGEMRDRDSIRRTITAAETGHLVLSTLHTKNAVQTIDRIINIFPPHQRRQVRLQLSANLLGIVSQNLMISTKGNIIPVVEILVSIAAVRKLIREEKTHQLYNIMQTRIKEGMKTFNGSLIELLENGIITRKDALAISPHPDEFRELLATKKYQKPP